MLQCICVVFMLPIAKYNISYRVTQKLVIFSNDVSQIWFRISETTQSATILVSQEYLFKDLVIVGCIFVLLQSIVAFKIYVCFSMVLKLWSSSKLVPGILIAQHDQLSQRFSTTLRKVIKENVELMCYSVFLVFWYFVTVQHTYYIHTM